MNKPKFTFLAILVAFFAATAWGQATITTGSLPNGTVGAYYNQWLGATESAEWSVAEGESLPPGLRLDGNSSNYNYIYGTPTKAGNYSFKIKLTNSNGSTENEITINIVMPPMPAITTADLPDGTVGEYYSNRLSASGNAQWSWVSGILPPGLQLNSYGDISGTPMLAGTYNFTLKATNATGSDTKAFTIIIGAEQQKPAITLNTVPDGTIGEYYSLYISSERMANWSIIGALPEGLYLQNNSSSNQAYISGTPTTVGSYEFTIKALNSVGFDEKTFTITIIEPQHAPTISTWSSLSNGKVGQSYWGYIYSDCVANWSIVDGNLPDGLYLQNNNSNNQAYISGTPTTVGSFTFTVKAENSVGPTEKEFTITIEMPAVPLITTTTLPSGTVGESYYYNGSSIRLEATDNAVWSHIGGTLPPGLYLESGGYISGTPTLVGSYFFTVEATNAAGSNVKELSITIGEPQYAPIIALNAVPSGTIGENYSLYISSERMASWSIIGALPEGLYLQNNSSSNQAYISGTPTTVGSYEFTIKALNSVGFDEKTLTIMIIEPQYAPTITTNVLPNGMADRDYGWIYISSTRAANWSIIEGDFPPGLNVDIDGYRNQISISGTPTEIGDFTFTVKAENSVDFDEKTFTISIATPPKPEIAFADLQDGTVGASYWGRFQATSSALWSMVDGTLPLGLWLENNNNYNSSYNYISGTPTKAGTYTFTIKIENAWGSSEETFTISIVTPDAPVITTADLPEGIMGVYYNSKLEATDYAEWRELLPAVSPGKPIDGEKEIEQSSSSRLPPGLYLQNNGYIYGTPTAIGTYTFTIEARNVAGSDTKEFSITIGAEQNAPVITYFDMQQNGTEGEQYWGRIDLDCAANWSIVNGDLPSGVNLQYDYYSNYNYISGYPTTPGTYTFTVRATNSIGYTERTFNVVIDEAQYAPQIAIALSSSSGIVGKYQPWGNIYSNRAANWSIEGDFPPGLNVDIDGYRNHITISGTPTEPGEFTFTIKAENSVGSDEETITITITEPPAPTIEFAEIPDGIVGGYYDSWLYATSSALWSIVDGTLPPGLWLENNNNYNNSYNYISGTPTKAGTYTFTIKIENAWGSSEATFTINVIVPDAPVITTVMLSDGVAGESYYSQLEATDYAQWSIVDALPPGLYLDSEGYIYGTPTKSGTYTFTVKATNVSGGDIKEFSITIGAEQNAPVITYFDMRQNGTEGEQYWGRIELDRAANWSIIEGSLPDGLNVNLEGYKNSLYISGYPTTPGIYSFTVRAENDIGFDERFFTITILEAQYAPRIMYAEVQETVAIGNGYYYSQWGYFESDRSANWVIAEGILPPGLRLESYGNYAYISGTPTTVGEYTFTVRAENSKGGDEREFTMTITASPPPEIVFANIPDGIIGKSYYGRFETMNYVQWSIVDGTLPDGLRLERNYESYSNYIVGTPKEAGDFTFTVKVTNSWGSSETEFTIKIVMPSIPEITTVDLPNGTVGDYYGELLEAITDYAEWSRVSGTLPPGLSLSSDIGSGPGEPLPPKDPSSSSGGSPSSSSSAVSTSKMYIEGTPRTAGTYNFTIKATNVAGSDAKEFSITIGAEQNAPVITTNTLPNVTAGSYYWGYIYSDRAANWSIEGNLPPDLILENANFSSEARISGRPTTPGTYTFTVKATNSKGSDSKTFIINIATPPAPVIANHNLLEGIVGAEYWGYISTQDYCNQHSCSSVPANWSITEGSLPPGIQLWNTSFNSHLEFYGTPTTSGEYTFTIKSENAGGSTEREFTITIVKPDTPEIADINLPDGIVGDEYWSRLESENYAQWSVISGSLPPGLRLYSDGGIGGYPREAGTFNFTVEAKNVSGSDTKAFFITIAPEQYAPVITYSYISGYNISVGDEFWGNIGSDRAANWSLEGDVPPGLKLESDFERWNYISGYPTTPGEYTFTVKVANAIGFDEKEFTIKINANSEYEMCIADGKVWEYSSCRSKTDAELCKDAGKDWVNEQCEAPFESPTLLPQIAVGKVRISAIGKTIALENVPAGAKVGVYNAQGKLISSKSFNQVNQGSDNMRIPVQTKGIYIVKIGNQTLRVAVR